MRRLLGPLAALAVALYAVLCWYSFGVLRPAANGLMPFDVRVPGYDVDAVRAYLSALDGNGRAVYLVEVRWLDTAFPVVLGVLLAGVVWTLTEGRRIWLRVVLCLPALAYSVLDLKENALVSELLLAGPEGFSEAVAALASDMTVMKFALLSVAVTVVSGAWAKARKG